MSQEKETKNNYIENKFALAKNIDKKGNFKKVPRVEACGTTYRNVMEKNIPAQKDNETTKQNLVEMFQNSLKILYIYDDKSNKYIFKLNKEKTLTKDQYDVLINRKEITMDIVKEQCQTTADSTKKPKKEKTKEEETPSSVQTVKDINKTVRKAMKKGFENDKNEVGVSLPTADIYGRSSYAPSPWLQILDEDKKYILAKGAGAQCTGAEDCTLDGHICVNGFCEMAESLLTYNDTTKIPVHVIRSTKKWTPTTAFFITKENPDNKPLEVKKGQFILKPFRNCPPRIIKKITVTSTDGNEITLNQLAANRTKPQLKHKIDGDYSVTCMGESHGRWLNAFGNKDALDHYNRLNNNEFKARAATNADEFKKLLENVHHVRLFDSANKGIPYVIVLEDKVLTRVYPFGTDLKTINQLYSQKTLDKALEKQGEKAKNYMELVRKIVTKESENDMDVV